MVYGKLDKSTGSSRVTSRHTQLQTHTQCIAKENWTRTLTWTVCLVFIMHLASYAYILWRFIQLFYILQKQIQSIGLYPAQVLYLNTHSCFHKCTWHVRPIFWWDSIYCPLSCWQLFVYILCEGYQYSCSTQSYKVVPLHTKYILSNNLYSLQPHTHTCH